MNEPAFGDQLTALLCSFLDVEPEPAIYGFSDSVGNEHLMDTFLKIGGLMDYLNAVRTTLAVRMILAEHYTQN